MLAVFPGPEYYFLCLYKMPDGGKQASLFCPPGAPAACCGLKFGSYPHSGNRVPRHTCHYVVTVLDVRPLQSQLLSYFSSSGVIRPLPTHAEKLDELEQGKALPHKTNILLQTGYQQISMLTLGTCGQLN